jgi:hypothetical protein
MASLAGEEARLPRGVMRIRAGGLPARPWEFNRCKSRLIFDEGAWKALLQKLGRGACLPTSLGRFLNEKGLQSFFDNGFLIRELTVLDLLSKKPLQVVRECDANHVESSRPFGLRVASIWSYLLGYLKSLCCGKN